MVIPVPMISLLGASNGVCHWLCVQDPRPATSTALPSPHAYLTRSAVAGGAVVLCLAAREGHADTGVGTARLDPLHASVVGAAVPLGYLARLIARVVGAAVRVSMVLHAIAQSMVAASTLMPPPCLDES